MNLGIQKKERKKARDDFFHKTLGKETNKQ